MYNGRSAQQESGATQATEEQHVNGGALKLYAAIILGVHYLELAF